MNKIIYLLKKQISSRKNYQKAFSLIEISLIMLIASVVSATYFLMSENDNRDNLNKLMQTEENLRFIQSSLARFRQNTGRLPCPSDIKLDYQVGNQENLNKNDNICQANYGSVPWVSLKIPAEYSLDGWGKKIDYYISPTICGVNCTSENYQGNSGNINVKIGNGSASSENYILNAAYVLLSHGASSLGSYLPGGEKYPVIFNSQDKIENINSDNIFVQASLDPNFDDILIYQTKEDLETYLVSSLKKPVTLDICQNNSAILSQINLANAVNNPDSLRNNINYINYINGDEAALDLMWNLQEVCYNIYNINRSCPGGAIYQAGKFPCYLGN